MLQLSHILWPQTVLLIFYCTFVTQTSETLSQPILKSLPNVSKDPDDVKLYLVHLEKGSFIRYRCVHYKVDETIMRSVRNGEFLANRTSVFIIHGFGGNGVYETYNTQGSDTKEGYPANFFYFSWGQSSGYNHLPPYEDSLNITILQALNAGPLYLEVVRDVLPIVWKRVAEYLSWFTDIGVLAPEKVHLVGHSLGAHIAGQASRTYKSMKGRKLARVTGLDPAGPLFEPGLNLALPFFQKKLTKRDADFVDCYHTNAGIMGNSNYADCHVDFKVNSGVLQPGCLGLNETVGTNLGFYICSHLYALKMFSQSDKEEMIGCLCPAALNGWDLWYCTRTCPFPVKAGFYAPDNARGYRHIDFDRAIPSRKIPLGDDPCTDYPG